MKIDLITFLKQGRKIVVMLFALFSFSCTTNPPLKTVSNVDIHKYMGQWFEIATIPQNFQKGCYCTTAEYTLINNNYVKVINTCKKDSVNGRTSQIEGKAFTTKDSAKFKVQFFWPLRAKYWIIDLADEYSYAVVGHPNRKYLWILSRSPQMDENIYTGIINRLKTQNYNTQLLVKTNQNCN